MTETLVIGYGNPLRGDDGLGWRAAEALAQGGAPAPITILTCQQLTPELAEPISQAQRVILIDAAQGSPPGFITHRRIILDNHTPPALSHHLEPGALLACAQALYGSAPPLDLWTVNGADFEIGETLSPAVEAALPQLIARIRASLTI